MYSMPVALMTSTMKSEPGLLMIFSPGSAAEDFGVVSAATVLAAAMLVLIAAALFRKVRRSSPSSLMRFSFASGSFARPIHEAVAVRHLYLRQRPRVHLVALGDDAIQVQQVCRHRVGLVIGQRLWIGDRHGAARVVEKRGRIRPVAADRAQRIRRRQRADSARQRVGRLAYAPGAMAGLALRHVYSLALPRVAATRRQSFAARRNADVPRRHLLRGRSAPERLAGTRRRRRVRRAGGERGERDTGSDVPMRKHWRRFRRPRPPRSGSSCCDNAAVACIA